MTWLLTSLRTKLGRTLAGVGAVLAALGLAYLKGRSQARTDAAEEYRDERKRQDDLDVGHGATDSERIKRLRDIANGR